MNTSDPVLASETLHPSFGEEDVNGALRDGADERYRPRPGEHAIPANRPINFALVGQPERGQDDALQRADRVEPARWELSGRDG